MADETPKKPVETEDSNQQDSRDQEWFDPQADYESGETLKAKQWETDHRLVDDNTALGNIHQGTEEEKGLLKTEADPDYIVSAPTGIDLPGDESIGAGRELPGELPLQDLEGQHGRADGSSATQPTETGGDYTPPDFSDFSIASEPDTAADTKSSDFTEEEKDDSRIDTAQRAGRSAVTATDPDVDAPDGAAPAGSTAAGGTTGGGVGQPTPGVTAQQDPSAVSPPVAAVITGDGGLVIEDELNQVSGLLTIDDPNPGESGFQPAIIKGTYGAFSLDADGNWSYTLAAEEDNVQSLAHDETVHEIFEVFSIDGTSHQLNVTVKGTNDTPVFTSVAGLTVKEDDPVANGRVTAADIDNDDTQTYSIEGTVPGLTFHPDGSYTFDPTHDEYQQLAEGQLQIIRVPVTVTDSQGAESEDTLVLNVTGTNDAPKLGMGGYQEVLTESFENFLNRDGWTIVEGQGEQNQVVGDHGTAWTLTDQGMEVQRGNIGRSEALDGTSHIELDGNENLSISTLVDIIEGQDYTLSFSYKPRPGKENSSDMRVSFGDRILDIESDGHGRLELTSGEGDMSLQVTDGSDGWSIITVTYPGMTGGSAELVLEGTGKSDSFGAYIDDLHMGYTNPVDVYVGSYVEQEPAVPIIDETFVISDMDDTELQGITVLLTNAGAGDQLVVGTLPEGIQAETSLTAEGMISLKLTGGADHQDYRQALQQVGFMNGSDFPDTSDRVLEITGFDAYDNSNTVTSTIRVTGVNDAPEASDTVLQGVEDTATTLTVADFGFSDVDGGTLSAIRITQELENGSLTLDGEPVAAGQEISVEDISMGRLVYTPAQHVSGDQLDSLNFIVNDGESWSTESATVTVGIEAVADPPAINATITEPRLVPVPGTGEMVEKNITIENYTETESGFRVLGRTINEDGNLSDPSLENVGTGQGGFAPTGKNAGPDYQLGVNLEHQVSEELIIEFDNVTTEANVTISRLFANEGGRGGHERGSYVLMNGDEQVGGGDFFAETGHQVDLNLTSDTDGGFDRIVFTAGETYQDGTVKKSDASDYIITGVQWQQEENCDMVWQIPLDITASLVDTDGSETLGPMVIEGLPPGAILSAGELVSGGEAAEFQATNITIREDVDARIIFEGEEAGYKNSFGYYKIDSDSGEISDVQIAWENASQKGSGGNLIAGESAVDVELAAGDQIGFFIISNGYKKNDFSKFTDGHFEFRNEDGSEVTVTSSVPELVFVKNDGTEVAVKGDVFHSAADDENFSLNPDNFMHARGELNAEEGSIQFGFEDLRGGGDKDYDDPLFSIEIGQKNVQFLASENKGSQTWVVDQDDLEGLTVTLPSGHEEPFDLWISAGSTESTGDSDSSFINLEIEIGEDGPYVANAEPEEESHEIALTGVDLSATTQEEDETPADLSEFVANEANGDNGLPGELEEFSAGSETDGDAEVPSLEEQVADAEQEAREQEDTGLQDPEVIPAEDLGDSSAPSDDIPTIV